MLKTYFKNMYNIVQLLSYNQKKKLPLILFILLISSLFEVGGLTSVVPFLVIVISPEIATSNEYMRTVIAAFNLDSSSELAFYFGFFALFMVTISTLIRAFANYIQAKFSYDGQHHLSLHLLKNYLERDFMWHRSQNTTDLGKDIISEAGTTMAYGLMPLLNLINNFFIIVLLLALLLVVSPEVTLILLFALMLIYKSIWNYWGSKLTILGKNRSDSNQQRFLIVDEAFASMREVKVYSLGKYFFDRFEKASAMYAKVEIIVELASNLPRFFIEYFLFTSIIIIVLTMSWFGIEVEKYLSLFMFFAISAYRLLPSFQSCYASMSKLRFVKPTIDRIHRKLDRNKFKEVETIVDYQRIPSINYDTSQVIKLENVSYHHDDMPSLNVLNNISAVFRSGTFNVILGGSGSGKSTLLDVLIGLMPSSGGKVKYANRDLSQMEIESYWNNLAYVPQSVFIEDTTLLDNIVLGELTELFDKAKFEQAIHISCINDLIDERGLDYEVGERGSNLSGGQRQRVGLARALYRDKPILILDEATAALDGITEERVLKNLAAIKNEKVIIMVSHSKVAQRFATNLFRMSSNGELTEIALRT